MTNAPTENKWEPLHRLSTVTTLLTFGVPVVVSTATAAWVPIAGLPKLVVFVLFLVGLAALLAIASFVLHFLEVRDRKKHTHATADIRGVSFAETVRTAYEKEIADLRLSTATLQTKLNATEATLQGEQEKTRDAEDRYVLLSSIAEMQHTARTAELAGLNAAVEEKQQRITALTWGTRYHVEYPTLRTLNPAQLDGIMPLLDQCTAAAKTASEQAEKVLMALLKRMEFVPPPSVGSYLALFIGIHILRPMKRTADLLTEEKADPRAALVTFAIRYHKSREWIQKCLGALAEITAHEPLEAHERFLAVIASVPSYPEWFAADREWFAKLDGVLVITTLDDVRGEIQKYCEINGLVRALPAAMIPA